MNAMTMIAVSDGAGGIRHVPAPYLPKAKGKKAAPKPDPMLTNPKAAAEKFRTLVERVERLEEDHAGVSQDIKDVYGEARSTGFDVKSIRQIILLRKIDPQLRDHADLLLEAYKDGIGL